MRNEEKELALRFILNTDVNIFLTGRAGTGKTYFLRKLREKCRKRMVVLAPTGIAAINAGGVTIHSFFQLPFSPYIPESSLLASEGGKYKYHYRKERLDVIRNVELIVIDEISMVRADLLDCIDNVMRRYRNPDKPFGGVQILMIGDLQQLPPVAKEEDWKILQNYYDSIYFFSSHALRQSAFIVIELKKIYRQTDVAFIEMLEKIRSDKCDRKMLEKLNERYKPGFEPEAAKQYIKLTTHNHTALMTNMKEMSKLPGTEHSFRAKITGNFPEYSFPTEENLVLKEGAQIMFVKNVRNEKAEFYNGMLGKVISIDEKGIRVCREGNDDIVFKLEMETWTNARYVLDKESGSVIEEIEGTFTQYPVKLAWAITIHKSQGLTFEKVIIDAASSFAHGQAYVALSRCRTLEGIVLDSPISSRSVINDIKVSEFMRQNREYGPDEKLLASMEKDYFCRTADALFDFTPLELHFKAILDTVSGTEGPGTSELAIKIGEGISLIDNVLKPVSTAFSKQYGKLVRSSEDFMNDSHIRERMKAAAVYYLTESEPLATTLKKARFRSENKAAKKTYREHLSAAKKMIAEKKRLLEHVSENGLRLPDYFIFREKQ